MRDAENLDNQFLETRQRGVTISLSAKGKTGKTEHYPCADLTFDELADMLTDHCIGDKDETGWTPFDFRDDIRESRNAIGADVAVLDIDDGTSLDTIEAALKKAGIGAIVASTFSHLSQETDFAKGKYSAWRKANPNAADDGFMRDQRKGYVEAVWRGSKIVRGRDGEPETKSVWNPKTKKNDEKITVRHAPCEKYRIIVLLAKPFFSDDHDDPDSAWETIVLLLAGLLKLRTDPQTLDRGRLFFGPRHPAGVRPAKRIVPGEPFDAERALARAREADAGRGRDGDGTRLGSPQARQSRSGVKVFAGNIEALRSGFMAVPHDDRIDMYDWIAGIGAVCEETDGSDEGSELAHDWSATWIGGYDHDETERVWRRAVRNLGKDMKKAGGGTIRQFIKWYAPDWKKPEGFEWGDGPNLVFENEGEREGLIESMNAEFAVVKNKGCVRILHQCVDEDGVDSFDLMRQDDFRLLTRARGVVKAVSANGKPAKGIPIADYWLSSPQRREFAGLVFRPGEESQRGEGLDRPKFLNLWTRWGVEPSPRGSCERLKNHMLDNICNGGKGPYEYLLDWCAHLVQRPREKPGVALVFRGVKGAGKSILGETLGKLVGKAHYFVASQPEQILGKHNAALTRTLLIQAEEAFFVHDPKMQGPLKDLITRETRTVEPKFIDAYIVEACDRLIMTSNKDAVVAADRGERRYTVFDVADTHATDTKYFGAIDAELKNGGYERFLYELLNRDLRGFDCRTAYETEALAKQKLHALDTTAQWAFDELTSGELWEGNSRGEPCFIVDKRHVRKSYLEFVRDMKVGHPLADARLGEWLIGNLGFKASRQRIEGKREPCYVLPALWEARERFIAQFELPTTIFDGADGKGPQKRRDVL